MKVYCKILSIFFICVTLVSCSEKSKTSLGASSAFEPLGQGINLALNIRNAQLDLAAFFSFSMLTTDNKWRDVFNPNFIPFLELKSILNRNELREFENNRWKIKEEGISFDIVPNLFQFSLQYNNLNNYFIRGYKENNKLYFIIAKSDEYFPFKKVHAIHFDLSFLQTVIIDEFSIDSSGKILRKRICKNSQEVDRCPFLSPYESKVTPKLVENLINSIELNESQFEISNIGDFYEKL